MFAYFSSALLSESKRSIKKAFQPVETRDSGSVRDKMKNQSQKNRDGRVECAFD